ncbi:benzoate transporter [Pseudomonas sp. LB-090624]|uniref:benzoate/H(+) symporter BenE family transporter n=1 Tax=Pseudomonas sp. LB-090624 TaxID=2213079 RepID=UPI000D8504F5|nr:benzoate/H(+) symporter BenE family transporter [Pseudomonas sp. LB-090624]PYB78934.1 benzoate transporter [Pseudomonas sp. LB-090624]
MPAIRQDLSLSAVISGFVAMLVSYAGPLVIVFQAAHQAHLPNDIIGSWIWAISIGSGVTGVVLSYWLKVPVITAWSTPGAALLVSTLPGITLAQAIGAYLVSAALIAAIALSGAFDRLMNRLPKAIASAMLAGILFRFGADLFGSLNTQPVLVLAMLAAYLCFKRINPRYAVLSVLLVGCIVAACLGQLHTGDWVLEASVPVWTTPEWNWQVIISVGLPLALVSLTGQSVPGIAVLRSAGYGTPARPMVALTALGSLLMAPFGAHGVNLAAITAAICTGPEAHENPGKRYVAGIACGVFYILVGTFGATLAVVFGALPKALIATLAGLALFGAIANGLSGAMADEKQREAALITFLVTASGMSFLGLAAAFWGIVFGIAAYAGLNMNLARNNAPTLERPTR